MCGLGRTAGSAAEMSAVSCGVSDFVDGGQRGDARRDAPAPDDGDFVPGLGASAGHPVAGTDDRPQKTSIFNPDGRLLGTEPDAGPRMAGSSLRGCFTGL